MNKERKIQFAYSPPLTLAYVEPGVKLLDPCKDFEGAPCGKRVNRYQNEKAKNILF